VIERSWLHEALIDCLRKDHSGSCSSNLHTLNSSLNYTLQGNSSTYLPSRLTLQFPADTAADTMSQRDPDLNASTASSSSYSAEGGQQQLNEDLPSLSVLFPPLDLPPADPEDYQPPYTDQTCFSWCVQSNHRRNAEYLPICRMICLNVDKKLDNGDDQARRDLLLGNTSKKGKEKAIDDEQAMIAKARRRVRRWIAERQIVLFKGDIDGLHQLQTEDRDSSKKRHVASPTTDSLTDDDIETATSREQRQRRPIKRRFEDQEWSIETRKIGEDG
jgi:hypothetical protein